jgi:hypothetical protein
VTSKDKPTLSDLVAEFVAGIEPEPVTDERIMHAAPGLAALLWRNTNTIETRMHAGKGVWSDIDMLRINARVTAICWEFLDELEEEDWWDALVDPDDDELALPYEFHQLFLTLQELLPETPKVRRKQYEQETHKTFMGQAKLYELLGLDAWLRSLTSANLLYPNDWWCAPNYPALIAGYLTLGPPEPETFEERALNAPWDLTDDQAWFVVERSFDAHDVVRVSNG